VSARRSRPAMVASPASRAAMCASRFTSSTISRQVALSNIALQQTGAVVPGLADSRTTARKARANPALRAGRACC
jgi:hypothetical protein